MRAARRCILAVVAAVLLAGALAGAGAAHSMGVNLALGITSGPTAGTVGTPLTYSLAATNNGDATAAKPRLWLRFGQTLAKITAAKTDQGECKIQSTGRAIVCIDPSLAHGASFHVDVTVLPSERGKLQVHVVLVTPHTTDDSPADNSGVIKTTILPADTGPPSGLRVTAGPPDAASTSFAVGWHISAPSPLSTYTIRYRKASWTQGFGKYVTWQHAKAPGHETFHGKQGWTYCFSAQGTDRLGAHSAWSTERCVSVPLGANSLRPSGHWTRRRASHAYLGTYRRASAKGATLWLLAARAKRIDVRVTRCAKCGKVAIFFRGKLLRQVALSRGKRGRGKVVRVLDGHTVRKGNIAIEVVSKGAPVDIEGIVAARN